MLERGSNAKKKYILNGFPGVLLGEGGLLVHKLLGALPEGHLRCQYSSD